MTDTVAVCLGVSAKRPPRVAFAAGYLPVRRACARIPARRSD